MQVVFDAPVASGDRHHLVRLQALRGHEVADHGFAIAARAGDADEGFMAVHERGRGRHNLAAVPFGSAMTDAGHFGNTRRCGVEGLLRLIRAFRTCKGVDALRPPF